MIRLILKSIFELFFKLFQFLAFRRSSKTDGKPTSSAFTESQVAETREILSDKVNSYSQQTLAGNSGFHLLDSNIDAFSARYALIQDAKFSIDIQTYFFHADTSGRLIAEALVKAADRGVRVRLLLDDIDTLGADEAIQILDAHPGIEIRIFNPFNFRGLLRYVEFIVDLSRVGRRMHNKSMVVDNSFAIVGGRNISDVYFSADPEVLFLDTDLLCIGPVVEETSLSFDKYWNSLWAIPVSYLYSKLKIDHARKRIKQHLVKYQSEITKIDYLKNIQLSKLNDVNNIYSQEFFWAASELLYDLPEKIDPTRQNYERQHIHETHISMQNVLKMATKQLTIISPYFVPGESGLKWFKALIDNGVSITVFTNSLAATDVVAVHAGYMGYREKLLKLGVYLFEMKATAYVKERRRHLKLLKAGSRASLHAKTIIIDSQKVFIGSPNLDPRSNELNTEMGLLVQSDELAQKVLASFRGISSGENAYKLSYELVGDAASPGILWESEVNGRAVKHTAEPEASLWRKFLAFAFSLLPFENLL